MEIIISQYKDPYYSNQPGFHGMSFQGIIITAHLEDISLRSKPGLCRRFFFPDASRPPSQKPQRDRGVFFQAKANSQAGFTPVPVGHQDDMNKHVKVAIRTPQKFVFLHHWIEKNRLFLKIEKGKKKSMEAIFCLTSNPP